MTAKEKLVDELSEAEAAAELRSWSARRGRLAALTESAPIDDEPFTDEDVAAVDESYADLAAGATTMPVGEFRRSRGPASRAE
ncbi:MAG: hypothetical protein GXY03_02505 [Solirubrobacterales bacterium]|nr:hypothetical protein [Solirubrobacterales bacterium]